MAKGGVMGPQHNCCAWI
ncbi:hypothetical protein HaLaN_23127 [Haematococcus lacustris]|uniref:Uncharacterized protein n=1 Tax=Haematococcus lacustris TaxID=44745 RepID=A0A699ZS65_HAELA|nr:hypothetical protein HaLaN_23127 [Haematococcus lacustris]